MFNKQGQKINISQTIRNQSELRVYTIHVCQFTVLSKSHFQQFVKIYTSPPPNESAVCIGPIIDDSWRSLNCSS